MQFHRACEPVIIHPTLVFPLYVNKLNHFRTFHYARICVSSSIFRHNSFQPTSWMFSFLLSKSRYPEPRFIFLSTLPYTYKAIVKKISWGVLKWKNRKFAKRGAQKKFLSTLNLQFANSEKWSRSKPSLYFPWLRLCVYVTSTSLPDLENWRVGGVKH